MSLHAGGRFITLEGGEGAGKSTQAARLVEALAARGIRAIATREPGGSPRAEEIRAVILSGTASRLGPLAEALLFSAARADHLAATIRPALARGDWVVCDRFADSTRAYQGAAGGLDAGVINALERIVVGDTTPDLTIVLDIDPAIGLSRLTNPDRLEAEPLEYHRAVRAAFVSFANGEIVGDNTDGPGLVADITRNAGVAIKDKRVLLLGAGGAARGALLPLIGQGPREIVIARRRYSSISEPSTKPSSIGAGSRTVPATTSTRATCCMVACHRTRHAK
jgi:dTMP kinase